jgi:osmotically-inducible protein OsmY
VHTDDSIKKDIDNRLYWNSSVDASDVSVAVTGGKAILKGTVKNYAALISAVSEVWSVDAVQEIENRLRVEYPKEGTGLSDAAIQQRVEDTLAWNPDLEEENINVSTNNGEITLSGSVGAYWKKLKAETIVAELKGVIAVNNELAVMPSSETPDQSIATYILEVVEKNLDIDTAALFVNVSGGLVSLEGVVPDKRAYQDVYNAAKYTLGVTDVKNHLTTQKR